MRDDGHRHIHPNSDETSRNPPTEPAGFLVEKNLILFNLYFKFIRWPLNPNFRLLPHLSHFRIPTSDFKYPSSDL